MNQKSAILINKNPVELRAQKNALKEVDPELQCFCFVFADEAVIAVLNEMRNLPDYILLDANVEPRSPNYYIREFRKINKPTCRLILFSEIMPQIMIDTFKSSGVTEAFQKPTAGYQYKEIMTNVVRSDFDDKSQTFN